jgi:hypothetical protein
MRVLKEVVSGIRETWERRKNKRERHVKKNKGKVFGDEFGGVDVVVVCDDENYDKVRRRRNETAQDVTEKDKLRKREHNLQSAENPSSPPVQEPR